MGTLGYRHTEKTKRKIAQTSKERWQNLDYKKQIALKISKASRGKPKSKEHKQALQSAWATGKNMGRTGKSQSTKQRLRIS